MQKFVKKLIRLWVMTKINYSEDYVKGCIKSNGVDIKDVTHEQLCAYRAALKVTEADFMIEQAFLSKTVSVEDIDISIFKKNAQ